MTAPKDPLELEFNADLVIRAYQAGIFPMSESEDDPDIFWVSPQMRGILPLDRFRRSRSLRKLLKKNPYQIRFDTDFAGILDGCAHAGPGRDQTWISRPIRKVYGELFERGICHTVEVWDGNELVGGLYGLALGGAFFGESMFHRRPNTSKIALSHLVDRLNRRGFALLDTQFISEHLKSLGGIEIPRSRYEKMLLQALQIDTQF